MNITLHSFVIIRCWIVDVKEMIKGDSGVLTEKNWYDAAASIAFKISNLQYATLCSNIKLTLRIRPSFWQPSFFSVSASLPLKCVNVQQSRAVYCALVWTKMFVEVVLVLLLYFSFFLADKLVLQSPEDTKCRPQPQTRNSERTSYYFWLKSNCFAFFHKDRLDTTTSRCSWLASL